MFRKTFLALGLAAMIAPAFAAEWTTDLEAARSKAAAEGKELLLDFTGSDWCGWCIRLRKDVLNQPEFESYAADKFVLVEIDIPQNPKFDPALRARNEKLCEQYKVNGFPTIMVLTPEGQVAGGFCGGRASFAAAKPALDTAVANAAKLKEAAGKEGMEKAALLAEVYSSLSSDLKAAAEDMRDTIVELDPDDKTGLRHAKEVREDLQNTLNLVRGAETPQEMLVLINNAEKEVMPENLMHIYRLKSRVLMSLAETEDDILAARDAALKAAEHNPTDGAKEKEAAVRAFADPAAVLRAIQDVRAKEAACPPKA